MLICAIFNSVETSFEPRLIPDTDRFTGNFPNKGILARLGNSVPDSGTRENSVPGPESLLVHHASR